MDFVEEFHEEIEQIYDDEGVQEFIKQALLKVPDLQLNSEDVEYVKRVVANTRSMCRVIDAEDKVMDLMTCAALLHAICRYDEVDQGFGKAPTRDYDLLHMLHVRSFLTELQGVIGREDYNNVMLLIESQEGFNSPIPQLMPRINDPAHMWILPFAIKLAKEVI